MRGALEDPGEAVESAKPLVRFTGGALTTRDYLRWVNALPPQYSARLRTAEDSLLKQFAKALAQNTLLLRDAEAGGIRLTAEEWSELTQRYRAQLDTLRRDMGLDAPELTDQSVPAAQRASLAADKVEAYFDRLKEGKSRLRPLPGALATLLRARLPARVDDAGLERSLKLANELVAARDSAAGGAPAGPPGAMRPAPGPAPIPGQLAPLPCSPRPAPPTAAPNPSGSRERRCNSADPHCSAVSVCWPALWRRPGSPRRRTRPSAVQDTAGTRAADGASRGPPDRRRHAGRRRFGDRSGPGRGRRRKPAGARVPGGRGALQPPGPGRPAARRSPSSSRRSGARSSRRSWTRSCWCSRRARHHHQGHRSGDRRRRRAAGPEGARQLQLRGGLPERAEEGRIPDARGVPPLAHRPAAPGGAAEPADRRAAEQRQAQAGGADRAGDAEASSSEQKGNLGTRPATISFRQIVVTPKPSAGGEGAGAGAGRLDRARAAPGRRLRDRRAALLPGPRLARPGRARSTGSAAA